MDAIVPFQRPQMPPAQVVEQYFARSRDAHWFSNEGPCVRLLIDRLEQHVGGGRCAVATASGTLGLMIALRAAAGPARDRQREVLVPSFTYIASVSAILWAGLEPVFVDVGTGHWHLDPDALDAAVAERGDRLAAVLACSTFGCAPPLPVRERWEHACARSGLPLVVDSAAGFGSRDERDRPLGQQGLAEVFSFHATKPLAVGEGGAVLTRDRELAEAVARQSRFGLDTARELGAEPGLNAKMSELHAAVALAALDGLADGLAARTRRAEAIRLGLDAHGFEFQLGAQTSASQFVPALAPTARLRDEIVEAASAARVQLRTYHQPLHELAALRRYARVGELSVTNDLASRTLSLPLSTDLTDSEIERVRTLLLETAGLVH